MALTLPTFKWKITLTTFQLSGSCGGKVMAQGLSFSSTDPSPAQQVPDSL